MGRYYWMISCIVIVGIFVAGLLLDCVLGTEDYQSITAWLRLHPRWYWWPATILVSAVLVLGIHLFGNGRTP